MFKGHKKIIVQERQWMPENVIKLAANISMHKLGLVCVTYTRSLRSPRQIWKYYVRQHLEIKKTIWD